ncbi:MAG: acetyl-CoA carboxylase biotin carboxylase subunit [Alphaproteobacteria bacterium]|nr:acetyl-CoA carboxylase biotin carboxylase subunit [Alphaproteobacteria bacterium]
MFKKILIANRGEIACRIIRTAKKMGIQTVAVYSEIDSYSRHVMEADEAVYIGPSPSSQSYLVADKIIDVIKKTGAEAVHPGYGFLSENAHFVQQLEKHNISFIGPHSKAIAAMGDKITSKKLAHSCNVPSTPGYFGDIKSETEAIKIANDIGYPVMIKASAGGGGKGMRIAFNDHEIAQGLKSAKNEAQNSFADDRVFIEKFIEHPRHIEIQILGDTYGNIIYLGERECSIQRRHQKIIEEAPSPFVTPELRKAMGEQAIQLAKAVNYCSAGTVEFIVDQQGNFYFLEMNTRLQVEHPVTELVTGIDLVEWMIKIAAGEKLSLTQKDVKIQGWAIEARIYAEDPTRNFLPSTGKLIYYQEPKNNSYVRIDSGVYEGSTISVYYDPMISKLCTFGNTRPEAINHMHHVLDEYVIKGVTHNIPFLSRILSHPTFKDGKLSTDFIDQEFPDGFFITLPPEHEIKNFIVIAVALHTKYYLQYFHSKQNDHPKDTVSLDWVIVSNINHYSAKVTFNFNTCSYNIFYDHVEYVVVSDWQLKDFIWKGFVNKQNVTMQVQRQNVGYKLKAQGYEFDCMVLSPKEAKFQKLMPEKIEPDMSRFVLSPMPGLLRSLHIKAGDTVKLGQDIAVIEAMKMENVLRSNCDGLVKEIFAKEGDNLLTDQKILEFE